MMSARKKTMQISQATFDGVVKENLEDFGMDLEEALQDAIHTFRLQGADLRGIITDGSRNDNGTNVPVAEAIEELQQAITDLGKNSANESVSRSLDRLYSLCKGGSDIISIAGKHGAVEASISAFKVVRCDKTALNSALGTLSLLIQDTENRDNFRRCGGPEMLMSVLTGQDEGYDAKVNACTMLSTSATCDELAMEQFMDLKAAEELSKLLKENTNNENLVIAICDAFRALVTADDGRVVASKAFTNARTFAEHGMVEALLSASTQLQISPSAVASICLALKSIAVNELICKSIAEQEGIDFVLRALNESVKMERKSLAKNACSLLSQLAGSDDNKDTIICAGGLERLINIMSTFSEDPSVLQETFTLITVLSLRSPQNACKAVQVGVLDMVAEAMEQHSSSANMQKQACFMLRNLAARSPENRSAILEKGLERLIRQAKSMHPRCKDAASGALRDLGFDDYNS